MENKYLEISSDMITYQVVEGHRCYWNTLKEFMLKMNRKVYICVNTKNALLTIIEVNDIDKVIK